MLEMIFWLLAILTMIIILFDSIHITINKLIEKREFKKFKEKQKEILNLMIKKYESEGNNDK